MVAELRAAGVRVVMLTGDNRVTAQAVAAAEVGIAMGAGSDVAIESAGITLLQGGNFAPSCGPSGCRRR